MLLLLACADEAAPPAPADPLPYLADEEDAPAPSLTAADLEGALDEALAVLPLLGAAPVFDAYDAAMVGAETGCPDWYESEGNTYWYDQCTATDGTRFAGYGFTYSYDAYDQGDGGLITGDALYGVARVETPEGATFEAGGSAYDYRVDYYEADGVTISYTSHTSAIAGAFAWDGAGADATWLGTDLSPDLTLYGVVAPAYDARAYYADGGLSGLGGLVDTVVFDELFLYDAALGSACPTEPGGGVSVRDADGQWTDILFDGPAEWGATSDESTCDGCGTAWFRGESLGEVCVDFSSLLGWGDAPW